MEKRTYEHLSNLTEEQKKDRLREQKRMAQRRYYARKSATPSDVEDSSSLKIDRTSTAQEKQKRKNELDRSYRTHITSEEHEEYLRKERERKKRALNKSYYARTSEKQKADKRAWYVENAEKAKLDKKKYREDLRSDLERLEKKRQRDRDYHHKKKLEDPKYIIARTLRTSLSNSIARFCNGKKDDSVLSLIGCTLEYFMLYIEQQFEPGMTWAPKNFHLDHKIPVSSFDFSDPEQLRKCYHYTNYQPLWPLDNLKKSNTLDWNRNINERDN